MKLRFILIGILVIVGGYFIYMNMPQEEKIIRENIAREVSLQAELTDKISKAENQIKQLQEAISGDNAKIKASVDVLEAYYRINYIKGYGWNPEKDKPSSGANTGGLQAPSENRLWHCQLLENGEIVKDEDGYGILETAYTGGMEGFTFVPDCGAFDGIKSCYIRQSDNSNCYGEILP